MSLDLDDRGVVVACPQCRARNRMTYERLNQPFRCGQCQTELRPVSEPVTVRSEAVFNAMIERSALNVLVDFWATWCGPCKMVAPELVKVAGEGAGRWLIAKVDTDQLPALAQRFQIRSIPTLTLFQRGREVARQAGAMPAADVTRFITSHSQARKQAGASSDR